MMVTKIDNGNGIGKEMDGEEGEEGEEPRGHHAL
jgi:hypothetical protein